MQNFLAALRAACSKISRFPLKELIFVPKYPIFFRGASRRFPQKYVGFFSTHFGKISKSDVGFFSGQIS